MLTAKERKTLSQQIQQMLPEDEAITAMEVQKFLLVELHFTGKLDELLAESTTPEVKKQIIDDLLKGQAAQRLHEARVRKQTMKIHNPTMRRKKDFEVLTEPGEKIKVAFWFIDKCGGVDDAMKALQAAEFALKKFEKNDRR